MNIFIRILACFLAFLLSPSSQDAQTTPIALTGTLITPQEQIENGTMLLQNGRIVASGDHVTLPAGTKVVPTGGIIAPGLIDLHNHLTWNIFPRWKPNQEFGSRYDWQQKPVYNIQMTVPHELLAQEGLECEAERYAEVKAITEGETSVTGSMLGGPAVIRVQKPPDSRAIWMWIRGWGKGSARLSTTSSLFR